LEEFFVYSILPLSEKNPAPFLKDISCLIMDFWLDIWNICSKSARLLSFFFDVQFDRSICIDHWAGSSNFIFLSINRNCSLFAETFAFFANRILSCFFVIFFYRRINMHIFFCKPA